MMRWGGSWLALGGSRPVCGIEVASGGLRAVACDATGGLAATAQVDWGTGNAASQAEAFRALAAAGHGLGREAVCCGPPDWVDALPLHLPGGGDLEELLVERARAHLSYPVEEAVLDYIGPEARDDGTRRALLVAMPRQRALDLLSAAERGGFRVRAVETAGAALHRLLHRAGRLDGRRTLCVHIERDHCLFLVLDAGALHVERALPWGEARLEQTIASQLEVPAATAAHLLRADPARGQAVDGSLDVQAAMREILAPVLRELATEVERVLGYCRAEFRGSGVDRVLVGGAAGAVPSLGEALQRLAPEAESAFAGGAAANAESRGLAVAYGLALRGLEKPCAD